MDDWKRNVDAAFDLSRLIETAMGLMSFPSPTGSAGEVSDWLAEQLSREGFSVTRSTSGHSTAPAVVVRLPAEVGTKTLQFNGHLDTVHLPFAAPTLNGSRLRGSGACDMKGGLAAAIEGLRILRSIESTGRGAVLLTAHDLHEAPWGDGSQLEAMIREGIHGDAVLIPEPLSDVLPLAGRGSAIWKTRLKRQGAPIHEVLRPLDQGDVLLAGANLVEKLKKYDDELRSKWDPLAGRESIFIGQFHSGEIYNQYPQECWLEGTRRWLPGNDYRQVEVELRDLCMEVAKEHKLSASGNFMFVREAFRLDPSETIVEAFQAAHRVIAGASLKTGGKPFVDDGNTFWAFGKIPAITHGPLGGGQHTTDEWVDVDDLGRVAKLYALTALSYFNRQ